jgi:hypothetical protein
MSQTGHNVERVGINAIESIVLNELKWLFREQPISDYGIDAHIEITEGRSDKPTGKLIALQIKSGKSYLREKTKDAYVFRGSPRHLEYWLKHSLPVIVVLYDPGNCKAYWQAVTAESVRRRQKAWKMEVPFSQTLGKRSLRALAELAEGPEYIRRLNQLVLAKPWMEIIQRGEELFLESDEWINKTMGRGSLTLKARNSAGEEHKVRD